jgi:hypothetical protein
VTAPPARLGALIARRPRRGPHRAMTRLVFLVPGFFGFTSVGAVS